MSEIICRVIDEYVAEPTGEEIVRCRDCKYGAYDGNECIRIDEWYDSLWLPVEPDGFCKWAKRRGDTE